MTYASHARVITGIIQANLIHLSIKMTTPHQSGTPFVGERVFQNRGVCGQAFPSFPSPTPFLQPFCSRPTFHASRMRKTNTLPEFRSLRTGTLATQASKVFEKEVFRQVYGYLTENCMLSRFQSGFRPKHSTVTALIQMCDEWLENMDNGKLNGVIFLDIKKAFDSINHGILLTKMKIRFGISSIKLMWFESYLSNREQQCTIIQENNHLRRPSGLNLGSIIVLTYILMTCLSA